MRVIKRYSNRKLYDTHESRYVTLDQLAELIRQGEEIRVMDNTTERDLTSAKAGHCGDIGEEPGTGMADHATPVTTHHDLRARSGTLHHAGALRAGWI